MTLYANEEIRPYDFETGETEEAWKDQREEDQIKAEISAGKSLENMKGTEGWGLVETFLTDHIVKYRDLLVGSTDFDQVKRLQEAIKAYSNVMVFVEHHIFTARNLQQRAPETQD